MENVHWIAESPVQPPVSRNTAQLVTGVVNLEDLHATHLGLLHIATPDIGSSTAHSAKHILLHFICFSELFAYLALPMASFTAHIVLLTRANSVPLTDRAASLRACHHKSTFKYDPLTTAHLLVGVEPAGLSASAKTYPLDEMLWYHNRSFSNLIEAVGRLSMAHKEAIKVQTSRDEDEGDLVTMVHKNVSQVLYVPKEDIDITRPLSEYGIDSMIAAELRNWIFGTFATEISLFRMLSQGMSIARLVLDISAVDKA